MANKPNINRTLIQGYHRDFAPHELARIREALDTVPGTDEGRREIWEKFQRNAAVSFYGRNEGGEIAFFVFYEVGEHKNGDKEFFVRAASALQFSHDLTESTFPQLENFARMLGCNRISAQTPRPGLVKKLRGLGYFLDPVLHGSEFVLRKLLSPVAS